MSILTEDEIRRIDDAYNWQTTSGRMAAYLAIESAILAKQREQSEPEGYFSVNDYGNWEETTDESATPLYLHPTPQPLPEGMVMVPREATKAMCDAADDEYPRVLEHDIDPYRVWRIMIAAAEKEAKP